VQFYLAKEDRKVDGCDPPRQAEAVHLWIGGAGRRRPRTASRVIVSDVKEPAPAFLEAGAAGPSLDSLVRCLVSTRRTRLPRLQRLCSTPEALISTSTVLVSISDPMDSGGEAFVSNLESSGFRFQSSEAWSKSSGFWPRDGCFWGQSSGFCVQNECLSCRIQWIPF
jgi:hypothetical protein